MTTKPPQTAQAKPRGSRALGAGDRVRIDVAGPGPVVGVVAEVVQHPHFGTLVVVRLDDGQIRRVVRERVTRIDGMLSPKSPRSPRGATPGRGGSSGPVGQSGGGSRSVSPAFTSPEAGDGAGAVSGSRPSGGVAAGAGPGSH